jgi:peptidoglycan/xylan/chitin deacetylase (PgdA/CDA1 family)
VIRRSARLRRSVEKTLPDLAALLGGRLPGFVYGRPVRCLPIFTYHVVGQWFEAHLQALRQAGFRTAGAEELRAYAAGRAHPDGRTVALTFDDGDISLTRIAAPLLATHGFRAVAFVVAGRVPPASDGDLAGWTELRSWVEAGTLEVGSHSLHHHHVPVSPELIGIVDPATETHFTSNIPIPQLEGGEPVRPGTPIFRGEPRYIARAAFRPDPDGLRRVREFADAAGPALFDRAGWIEELARLVPRRGVWETRPEADAAVVADMRESLRRIAAECPNPAQSTLCYPWYARTRRTDVLAAQAGVTLLLGGIGVRDRCPTADAPPLLQRLPEDLIWRLPGPDRQGLASLIWRRGRALPAGMRRLR